MAMIDFEKLYSKYNVSDKRIKHMKKITKTALVIAGMLDLKIDKKLLARAGLLHDLGSSYFQNRNDLSDFEKIWAHQVKTKEWIQKEGFPKVASVASRHNAHGLTKKEVKEWSGKKNISLMPNGIESKILAFADSMRKEFVNKKDCVTITNLDYKALLKKHGLLKKLKKERKNYLITLSSTAWIMIKF